MKYFCMKLAKYNKCLVSTVDTDGLVFFNTRASIALVQITHPVFPAVYGLINQEKMFYT